MIDATVRLLPDVLGNNLSAQTDSHSTGLWSIHNIPDYFQRYGSPAVLTNGNHKLIAEWQLKESLRRTFAST